MFNAARLQSMLVLDESNLLRFGFERTTTRNCVDFETKFLVKEVNSQQSKTKKSNFASKQTNPNSNSNSM